MGFTVGVLALGIAVVINILFKRIDIPVIIGYIVTGVIIVYAFDLRALSDAGALNGIAEFGIVFLMFMIGLEFNFPRIKSMKQEVLIFGGLQVILTMTVFFLISHYVFGSEVITSIIIACAFSLSSTAIVLKSFEESRVIGTGYGRSSLGILIMQDIAVIPILLMVAIFSNQDAHFVPLLIKTMISAIVVLFILFVPGKFVATRILKFAADTHMDEIFVGTVLFIVLGAALLSEYFEFSHSLGAFIAGMVISSSKYKYQVEADLTHFRDIFLGLFFVTVGMQVNLEFLMQNFFLIGVFLILVMCLKVGIIFTILKLFRKSAKVSLKTALALCQIGEFSFAIFLMAQQNQLLQINQDSPFLQLLISSGILESGFSTQEMNQSLTLMVILSMIATPFILKNLRKIAELFLPQINTKQESCDIGYIQDMKDQLAQHVVVCGYGTFGQETVRYLKEAQIPYIAIDYNLSRVEEGNKKGDYVVFGNIAQTSILDKLNLSQALAVIIALDHTSRIQHICESILAKFPHCKIVAKVATEEEEEELRDLNLPLIINEKREIARILSSAALKTPSLS
ncbi:cation:proton antiporter [Helicobacter kayseriensis]|uniref:cation:proton antiporter n=1 Tax=Helicobacter kayseriensis TaxID=2905877 RepID=UPI001E4F2441|nr:cation:proton antiporter [Helicobacter kayseriensis]MCE3046808.1 cation:proton antiporter [Helicobacter kayseriensis]MCE3047890.1 cation:proton antiporter [Helicobacter kayseriensis]